MGFFFVATRCRSEDCSAACLFGDTGFWYLVHRAGPILGHGPTANQKSDVSAAHTVMPTSNTTQSKGVNPNSLPSLMTYAIVAA
jgi:hypothetical protein